MALVAVGMDHRVFRLGKGSPFCSSGAVFRSMAMVDVEMDARSSGQARDIHFLQLVLC